MNVFITGASSGIGAALARVYGERGAHLGLFARRKGALQEVARGFPGDRVATFEGDVGDPEALIGAAAAFMTRFGVPDVVIANAGISQGADTLYREDLDVFRRVFATNVLGLIHTFHPFIAAMREAHAGRLVGIASVAGFRGLPGGGAYSASKAAAISYLESLRVELADTGVRVVTICPGYIATAMTAHNTYRMPFIMDVDRAARAMARAIDAGRRWYVLPWPMAVAGGVLRALPRAVFDALFAHAPRKARQSPDVGG